MCCNDANILKEKIVPMERNLYLDSLKGYLICLVVFGHMLSLNLTTNQTNLALYNVIYIFHMPLFIFVSGYFSKINSPNYKFGCLKIIETYIVFQLIRTIIEYPHDFFHQIFQPRTAMWYLLSLFYWKVFLYIMPLKLRNNTFFLLTGSLLIALLGGFLHYGTLMSFQRSFYFLPFFILGFYLQKINLNNYPQKLKYNLVIFILVSLFIFCYINNSPLYLHFAGFESYNNIWGGASRLLYITISFIVAILFLRLFSANKLLIKIGKETLFIYIYHSFICFYLMPYLHQTYNLPTSPLFIILYSFATIYFLFLLSKKTHILHYLINPFTGIYKSLKTPKIE